MKVAIATESFLPSVNGVTTSVCRVTEQLTRRGHEVLVIAPRPAPQHYRGATIRTVKSMPVRSFNVGVPTGEVWALLRRFRPDVVHAASPFVLGFEALQAGRRLGAATVAVYQTDMPSYLRQHTPGFAEAVTHGLAWRWVNRIHSFADLTLAPSHAAAADLRQHGITAVEQWGRGVDAGFFGPAWRFDAGTRGLRHRLSRDQPSRDQLRRDQPSRDQPSRDQPSAEPSRDELAGSHRSGPTTTAPARLVVGYVGRLAPEKELARLAELANLPGLQLVLVGDGPERDALQRLFARRWKGRADTPIFLGERTGEDLARCYAAFDVFVHTGTKETFGQTVQEAQASALPVVAPAAGGPLDLIHHGETGLLFDPETPGALAREVERLHCPQLRAQIGAAALAAVSTRDWSRLVEQLLGYYDSVRPISRAVRAVA